MGRVQQFDTDQVVRAARSVFWRHGYEGAALSTLEQATGLNRSSIYHAFGSKRGLFDAAVHSYLDEIVRPRLGLLSGASVTDTALVDYLTGLRTALLSTGSAAGDGCLLVNTAGSPLVRDQTVAATVTAYRAELRSAIGRGVDARFPDRELNERQTLAEACTASVIAAFVLVRVDPQLAAGQLDAARGLLS